MSSILGLDVLFRRLPKRGEGKMEPSFSDNPTVALVARIWPGLIFFGGRRSVLEFLAGIVILQFFSDGRRSTLEGIDDLWRSSRNPTKRFLVFQNRKK